MPTNTEYDASGALVGCDCDACGRMRETHARATRAFVAALEAMTPQAAPTAPVDSNVYCAYCGTPCGEDNPAVAVGCDNTDPNETDAYGQTCCVDRDAVRIRTDVFGVLRRQRSMVYISDSDFWVHRSRRGDYYYCSRDDQWYEDRENAPDWNADPETEDNGLLYYGTNVLDHCTYDPPGERLVMGVELEMESQDISVDTMVRRQGGPISQRYILKSDGSLSDGIELVTVPLTLAEHADKLDWQKTLAPFRSAGFVSGSTSTCGIHIHVNRAALSALTIGKLLVFLNSARPDTHAFVSNIAQRKPTGYCARYPKTIRDGQSTSSDKYDALHLLPRTIEFRVFRGNMRPERILKNLEFVHALCTYMPSCSVADVENVQAFLDWVFDNRKQYPNLHAFILEKNARPAVLTPSDDDSMRESADAEYAAA